MIDWNYADIQILGIDAHPYLVSFPIIKDGNLKSILFAQYKVGSDEYKLDVISDDIFNMTYTDMANRFQLSKAKVIMTGFTRHEVFYHNRLSKHQPYLVDYCSEMIESREICFVTHCEWTNHGGDTWQTADWQFGCTTEVWNCSGGSGGTPPDLTDPCDPNKDVVNEAIIAMNESGDCGEAALEAAFAGVDKIKLPKNFDTDCPCFNEILNTLLSNDSQNNWYCDLVTSINNNPTTTTHLVLVDDDKFQTERINGSNIKIRIPKKYCTGKEGEDNVFEEVDGAINSPWAWDLGLKWIDEDTNQEMNFNISNYEEKWNNIPGGGFNVDC